MRARALMWAVAAVAVAFATGARGVEDEDEEIVVVEDVISDERPAAADHPVYGEQASSGGTSRSSGRGRKKYDERRKVNKVSTDARHKGNKALAKYSEKELRAEEMRSLVLREAEHVAKETIAATEEFDSAFIDDDLVIRMGEQLAAVRAPFGFHYQTVKAAKGSPDLEQVERVQGLIQSCEARFKKQIALHRMLLQSTFKLLNGAKDADSKNLRRVARNRVAAIDKAEGPVPLVRKKLEKMLASKSNLKEMLDVQKRVRPALQFGLVREELLWFFGLAVLPFVLQIVSRGVLLLFFAIDHTLAAVNVAVCVLPPLFSAFRAANEAGLDFLTEAQMAKLAVLAVGCCAFLLTLHRSASGVLEGLAKARKGRPSRKQQIKNLQKKNAKAVVKKEEKVKQEEEEEEADAVES